MYSTENQRIKAEEKFGELNFMLTFAVEIIYHSW